MKNKILYKILIKNFCLTMLLLWIFIFLFVTLIVFVFSKVHNNEETLKLVSSITKISTNQTKETSAIIIALNNLVLYFFIHPLAWLLNQLCTIILYLGSGNLLNDLMFNNSGLDNLPKAFWIVLIISFVLSIIFIIYKLIFIMINNYQKQLNIISSTSKNIILLLIFTPLVPTIFYLINQLLIIILYYLMYKTHFMNLSILIFNSSFLDHINNMTQIPVSTDDSIFTDKANFSYFLCSVTYLALTYVIFNVCKKLLIIIFELVWLFITTIMVLFSIIAKSDDSYQFLRQHNLMILQHLLMFLAIFLTFNIFLSSISIIIDSIENTNWNIHFSKSILILIIIYVYAFFIITAPLLVSNVIGNKYITNPFEHSKTLFIGIRKTHSRISGGISNISNVSKKRFNKYKNNKNIYSYDKQIKNNINLKNNYSEKTKDKKENE